jgi:hypothetical protein
MRLQQGFAVGEMGFRVRLHSSNREARMSAMGQADNASTLAPIVMPTAQRALGQSATYALDQIAAYSITSSARASNDGETVRPRILAVVRLMTSSNLVGC